MEGLGEGKAFVDQCLGGRLGLGGRQGLVDAVKGHTHTATVGIDNIIQVGL